MGVWGKVLKTPATTHRCAVAVLVAIGALHGDDFAYRGRDFRGESLDDVGGGRTEDVHRVDHVEAPRVASALSRTEVASISAPIARERTLPRGRWCPKSSDPYVARFKFGESPRSCRRTGFYIGEAFFHHSSKGGRFGVSSISE